MVMSVIFVGGGVAGYCVGTMQLLQFESGPGDVAKTPDKFTEFLLAHLKKDLSLTEAQYPQVEKIVLRHHVEFDKIRKESQAAFAKEMAKMDVDMFAVLNEAQAQLWKTRMERMRSHWRGSSRRDKGNGKPGSERKPDDQKSHGPKDGVPANDKPKSTSPTTADFRAKPAE